MGANAKPTARLRKRWLAATLLLALALASGSAYRFMSQGASREGDAAAAITAAGGRIYYRWQHPNTIVFPPLLRPQLVAVFSAIRPDPNADAVR